MDDLSCDYDECRVLLAALRSEVAHRWPLDRERIRSKIRWLTERVEASGPREPRFQSGLELVRSFLALGQPLPALDHLDQVLSAMQQSGLPPRHPKPGQ